MNILRKIFKSKRINALQKLEHLFDSYNRGQFEVPNYNDEYDNYCLNINKLVRDSEIFKTIDKEPTPLQYFVHTTLRFMLNDKVIEKYSKRNYECGKDELVAMFNDGWKINGIRLGVDEVLRASRYHAIGNKVGLNDGKIYNPKYNVKLNSSNKIFERIYNVELQLFLDQIRVKYKKDFLKIGNSTNIETYNYGGLSGHGKLDVMTYNAWGNDYYDGLEDSGVIMNTDKTVIATLVGLNSKQYCNYLNNHYDTNYLDMKSKCETIIEICKRR